jgi:hypothetical protein
MCIEDAVMEAEMSKELVVGIVVMVFQFGILIIISLISYIFKTSIDNIRLTFGSSIDNILAMIKDIKNDRVTDIRNREKNDDEIFDRLRTVESKVNILEATQEKK